VVGITNREYMFRSKKEKVIGHEKKERVDDSRNCRGRQILRRSKNTAKHCKDQGGCKMSASEMRLDAKGRRVSITCTQCEKTDRGEDVRPIGIQR